MSNICEHGYLKRKCPHCEIFELERENAHLRAEIYRLKRGGWINVKERLPEIGDTVLVYYRRGDYRGAYIMRYIGHWLTVDPLVEVTHWQPLPEPPDAKDR